MTRMKNFAEITIFHTKYLWNLSYGLQEIRQELRDLHFQMIFFKDHSGSSTENWLEVRQEAGNIREQVIGSDDFLNEGTIFGVTVEVNTFNDDKTNRTCSFTACWRNKGRNLGRQPDFWLEQLIRYWQHQLKVENARTIQ